MTINIAAEVFSIQPLTGHVFELYLKPDKEIQYKPGQWISIRIPIEGKRPAKRAYSMMTPVRSDGLVHLIFDLVSGGLGSTHLSKLEVGDQVEIINMMGNFVLGEERPKELVFFARYTGLVPVFAILKQLESEGYTGRVLLIYISPCESEVFYREEIEKLAIEKLEIELILLDQEDTEFPEVARMERCLRETSAETAHIYICGVGNMVKPLRKQVLDFGWPRTQMKAERFN